MNDDSITVGGDRLAFRVTAQQSAGAMTALDVRIAPGGGPPALHRHDPAELYRVEQGELALYVEDDDGEVRRTVASAGDVVLIPAGREHTIRNESERDARAFVVFSPAGAMDVFFSAAGALAAQGRGSVPETLALAREHGIEVTRPLAEVA